MYPFIRDALCDSNLNRLQFTITHYQIRDLINDVWRYGYFKNCDKTYEPV